MSPVTTPGDFDPVPSIAGATEVAVTVASAVPSDADLVGVFVASAGPLGDGGGVDQAQLDAVGFTGAVGSTQLVPTADGPITAAVGIGSSDEADLADLRDAAGAVGRISGSRAVIAVVVPDLPSVSGAAAAGAIVEGVLLARYRYDVLRRQPVGAAVRALVLVVAHGQEEQVRAGAERGRVLAAAGMMARDLANTPHSHLSASTLAALAESIGPQRGLTVEVFGKDQLIEMGCGGLLGVNAGSVEPPQMIKLAYRPDGAASGHLGLVGKGIMYDSGGLSLKPGDEVHAQMKNDMTGAAAVFAAMCALADAGCTARVTAFLACTDNMPSGTAMALGDVITMRDGTTVEVVNTDAEGRLVMADALVLAAEEAPDAIVDIATLTGACMRALGTGLAGVMGNDHGLVDQVRAAGAAVDEPVWELPLEPRYRQDIMSPIADLRNLGTNPNGGAIHAALFLAEFVGTIPWAHIDIAGVAQTPRDALWRTEGCSGFGARLLVELAVDFTVPAA